MLRRLTVAVLLALALASTGLQAQSLWNAPPDNWANSSMRFENTDLDFRHSPMNFQNSPNLTLDTRGEDASRPLTETGPVASDDRLRPEPTLAQGTKPSD